MRIDSRSTLFFLAGVLIGVLTLTVFLMASAPRASIPDGRSLIDEWPEPAMTAPLETRAIIEEHSTPASSASSVPVQDLSSTLAQRLKSARDSAAAGRLQEARELYLQAMAMGPDGDTKQTMIELSAVLRRLAGGDSVALIQQADKYEDAVARGVGTGEHYTPITMSRLAKASRIAANQIRIERAARQARQTSISTSDMRNQVDGRNTPPRQPMRTLRARPRVTPTATIAPRPRPVRRTPTPQVAVREPIERRQGYIVQIGPMDAGESSEIAGRLTASGFVAKLSRIESPRFRVSSGPLARNVAERRAEALREMGFTPRLEPVRGGRVRIDFGLFVRADRAQSLAKRMRAIGYPVQTVRETALRFLVTIGPHPRPTADSIVKMVPSRLTVRVDSGAP